MNPSWTLSTTLTHGVTGVLLLLLIGVLLDRFRLVESRWMKSSSASSPKPTRVGLVIAHPDDESMFFLPTITYLRSLDRSIAIHLLCLSSGDADGLGRVRVKELESVARLLQLASCKIGEEETMRDGMKEKWKKEDVAAYVEKFVHEKNIEMVTIETEETSSFLTSPG